MRLVDLASMVLDLSSTVADMGARISAKLGRRVSCSRGCGACCRQITPLSPPEAIMIAELVESLTGETRRRIQKRFTAATRQLERSGILAKLAPLQNPSSLSEKDMLALSRAYFRQQIPCPFLANESCSIYAFRPSRCREYLVSSPAKHCRDPYEQHIEQLPVSIRLSEALGRMWAEATQTPLQLVPLTLAPAWSAERKPDRSIGADAHRMMDVLLFHVTKLAAEYERQNLSSLKGNG